MASGLLLLLIWQWRPVDGVVWHLADLVWRTTVHTLYVGGWLLVVASTFAIDHFELFVLSQTRRGWSDRPDELYVADITYLPTWAGFLFLAVVLDVCTRRVVGWAMANHLRTALVVDALNMALSQRRPQNVIHHSDHMFPTT